MAQGNSAVSFRQRAIIDPANDYKIEDLKQEFFLPAPNALGDGTSVQLAASYTLQLGVPSLDNLELDISAQSEQSVVNIYVNEELCELGKDYRIETDSEDQKYILFTRTIPNHSKFRFNIDLRPDLNSSAEGLYISEDRVTGAKLYGTQNEERGLRRIVPIPDRPSVPISSMRTIITAPLGTLPVLLSNGDLLREALFYANGQEYKTTEWFIDRPMPGYLFALLAGKLDSITDTHINQDGSKVDLFAFTDPGSSHRALVALSALKKAMVFDEERYGFTFPFKQMKMAGIASFNFQGMENNTLVIFNIMAILSDPRLSTDDKIRHVIRVVAHEYFHTFTGNEVTIKDFTEPALKEGLTTYREIQFTRDIFGPGEDVRRILILRDSQFLDDRSGIAHAVFPGKGLQARLLYDDTTYRKGAFLYGVLHTLIGDKFYDGMKLYRERFTGRAGNFADFQKVMSEASGKDLSKFFKWFKQAGTPVVTSHWFYTKAEDAWTLSIEQKNPLGGPVLMPLPIRFLDDHGTPMSVSWVQEDGSDSEASPDHTLAFARAKQTFKFKGVGADHPPLVAFGTHLLPIIFTPPYSDAHAAQLIETSSLAPMLRYEAAQHVLRKLLIEAYGRDDQTPLSNDTFDCLIKAYRIALKDDKLDPDMKAYLLKLPSSEELSLLIGQNVDNQKLKSVRVKFEKHLGQALGIDLEHTFYTQRVHQIYAGSDMAGWVAESKKRALRIAALRLLYAGDPQFYASRVCDFASDPKENITERLAAFKILGNLDTPLANKIVEKAVADLKAYNYLPLAHEFESMSSTLENDAVFEKVRDVAEKALGQETFVANEIFASADTFIVENAVTLHGRAAETYPWIGSVILRLAQRGNSNVATRITRHFTRDIALLPPTHQGQMREVLQHLQESGVALGAPTNQVIERALRLVTPQSSLANPDDCPAA